MNNIERSDEYWNGAIDAFYSEGHESITILHMIMSMGCPEETARDLCGLEADDEI